MALRVISFIIFLLFSVPSFATEYFVETTGGDGTQCDGKTDVALAGSTGGHCAYNHPRYALDWACGDGGACSSTGFTPTFVGGDTLTIGPGQYMVGYDTGGLTPGCGAAFAYDCTMGKIPTGPDAAHPTIIRGKGWDTPTTSTKPQLWGNEAVWGVLYIGGNNINVQFLEITDHSSCILDGPFVEPNINGTPVQCVDRHLSPPFGPYAINGLVSTAASTNVNVTNVDIHGIASNGVKAFHNADWTLDTVKIIANGTAGWESDDPVTGPPNGDAYTGTTTLIDPRIEWSGCGEKYPLSTSTLGSSSNAHHCWSQAMGGYGDAIGLGDGNPGNWTIYGRTGDSCSISYNVSDGVDLLHGSGSGTVKIYRCKIEGNAGQPVKLKATRGYIENSAILANCGFHKGQAFTSTVGQQSTSTACAALGAGVGTWTGTQCRINFETCRAASGAITLVNAVAGQKFFIYNNTVASAADIVLYETGSGCDATTSVDFENNIVQGMREFNDDTANNSAGGNDTTDLYFNDGTGSCSTLTKTIDYNLVSNTKNISTDPDCSGGAHNQCNVSPSFTGTFAVGPTTYYNGTAFASLLGIQTTSLAKNAGLNTLTYQGGGTTDYNAFARVGTYDLGAFEYGSTSSSATCGNGVRDGSEQCEGADLNAQTCVSQGFASGTLACSGSCTFDTSGCVSSTPGFCGDGTTQAGLGETCDDGNTTNGDCCSAICETEVSGYERLLQYTKSDPSSHLTVTTHKVVVTSQDRNSATTLVKDDGASHFGDFTHTFQVDWTSCVAADGTCSAAVWAVGSSLQPDLSAMESSLNGAHLELYQQSAADGGQNQWQLCSHPLGTCSNLNDSALPLTRYIKVVRSGTTITANVYSASDYSAGSLVGSMSIIGQPTTLYRYFYPFVSRNDGFTDSQINLTVQNINIGESILSCSSGGGATGATGNVILNGRCTTNGRLNIP